MAKNQIIGKVIAVSDQQVITSKESGKQVVKRQLYIDCTRFDPYTGERGYENTPLLEFTHKGLEKLEALVAAGLKKDDVVTITFDVQGNRWTNQDGKTQVITSIRPYDIELTRPTQGQPEQAQAQAQTQSPAPVRHTTQDGTDGLPF